MNRPSIDPWRAALALVYLVGLIATLIWAFHLDARLPCADRAASCAEVTR